MKIYLLPIVLLLLIAACKKDNSISQQGQITFTVDGVNYAVNVISSGDSIFSSTTSGVQDNTILFGGHNGGNIAFIQLDEMFNSPHSLGFDIGAYHSMNYDSACSYPSNMAGCHLFNFMFTCDSFNVASYLDSAAVLNVTSFSTTTHLMSGTFHCYVSDSYTLWLPLTNGKFTNVPFFTTQ